jgi:alpha-amylase
MGEEFATPSPFCFFVDFGDEWLRKGVIEGRKRDYEHHNWSEFISPLEEAAFLRSKLPEKEAGDETTRQWYRDLIYLRKDWLDRNIICGNQFDIHSDPERQLIVLSYDTAWIAVRLSDEKTAAQNPQDKLNVNLEVHLHSQGDVPDRNQLGLNQAIVGIGKFQSGDIS